MNEYKTRVYAFEAYGLNKNRNIIHNKDQTEYKVSFEEIIDMASDALIKFSADTSAVFLYRYNNEIYCVLQIYVTEEAYENFKEELNLKREDIGCVIQKVLEFGDDARIIGIIDARYLLNYYGLVIESRVNRWKAVEE